MSLYKKIMNPYTGKLQLVYNGSLVTIKESVDTYNSLPITGNSQNDLRITQDTDKMYTWSIASTSGSLSDWKDIGSASSADWSSITNGPSSTPTEIDDAVTVSQDALTKTIYDIDINGIVDNAEAIKEWTLNTTDICTGGTANASNADGSYPASNCFDDNTATYWQYTFFASGDWISYTLVSALIAYRYRFYHSGFGEAPDNFALQGYTGSTWVTLDTQNVSTPPGDGWTDWYSFDNTMAYIAYRIIVYATSSTMVRINEIEINDKTELSISATDINNAVTKKHTQNTDTALGIMVSNVNMNTHKLTGLAVPSVNGDSIRATSKITETKLEDATDHKDLTSGNPHSVSKSDVSLSNVVNVDLSKGNFNYIIDGGGSAITTGIKSDIEIPFDCTITSVTLLGDQSGSIVIDLWKTTYSAFDNSTHPVVGDSITASAKPTLSSASKSTDSTLTGWTKSITSGDIIRVNVDSCTTTERCVLIIGFTRT